VTLDHLVLHRVQGAIGFLEAFNGLDRFTVESRQQLDAAVDRDILDAVASGIEFTHHHHTGTAITFSTALFGACAMELFAKIVQNSGGPAFALGFDDFSVKHKAHGVGDLGHGEDVVSE
jgi:hypothetical protein